MQVNEQVTTPTDEELITSVFYGNISAFDMLVERYFGMVCMIAYARLHDLETSEDLAQEVFLRAFLNLKRLEHPSRFAPWISHIARNLSSDWLRERRRSSQLTRMVALESIAEKERNARMYGGAEIMERKERDDALRHALVQLPPELSEIVLLYFSEDLSKKEIARRLSIHPSTVGRKIRKALASMKSSLEPMLRDSTRKLRPSRKAVSHTIALISSTVALSASTRSSLMAAASDSVVSVSFDMLTEAAGNSLITNIAGGLQTIPTRVVTGIKSLPVAKSVAISVAAATIAGGTLYYGHNPQKAGNLLRTIKRNLPFHSHSQFQDSSSRTIISRIKSAAKKAGVEVTVLRKTENEIRVRVEWRGGNAARGGDFLDVLLKEGVIHNFDQVGKGFITKDGYGISHHTQIFSLRP